MADLSGGNLWSAVSRAWTSLFLQTTADSQTVSAEMGNFSWGLDVTPNSAGSVENAATSAANDLFANLAGEQLGDSPSLLDSAAFVDSQAWNQTLERSRGGESVQNMQASLGNLSEAFYNRQKELVGVPSEWEMRSFPGEEAMKNFTGEDTTFSTITTENGFSHFNSSAALSDLGSPTLQTADQTVTHSISCANRFNNRSLQLSVPQFDMARIKQERSMLDQSGSTLISQGLESDAYSKQDIPFLKAMAYDNGQAFMQGDDQYPHPGLWPSTNSFPVSLSQILPTSSQPVGLLNTNRNSPIWDLICSKSDLKPLHAIQNFPHFGQEKKVQMNRITQHLTRSYGDDGRDCSSETAKRCSNESSTSDTIFKRPRLDSTNCAMPTFKVRKEKLGDRITALQQLVSPFGKTDTASVLLEAIGYIKFLHDQVQVLSTPYMNNGAANSGQGGETAWAGGSSCEGNDSDGAKQDLRSRGLCLVPVSATLSVTNDNGADYWSPALGCNYR